MKLFCLAHAGGSANAFLSWKPHLQGQADVVPIEISGHGRRLSGTLHDRFEDVLADVVGEVTQAGLPDDYALFGHSFGAILAYELAHTLVRRGSAPPAHVFVSGSCSPDRVAELPFELVRDDRELLQSFAYLGATPQEIVADAEAVALFAPILRADLRALADYQFEPHAKLAADVSIVLGTQDELASSEDATRWALLFSGRATKRSLEGGHFAALEQPRAVASWIGDLLAHTREQQVAG